jgi:ParB-like chromosome segregation protein Spo0J
VGLLGLAHAIERQIQAGAFKDYSEVARRLGLSRAGLTQLMDLTLLARDLQEQIFSPSRWMASSRWQSGSCERR